MLQTWYGLLHYAHLIHQTGTIVFIQHTESSNVFTLHLYAFVLYMFTFSFVPLSTHLDPIYAAVIILTFDLSLYTNTYVSLYS